MPQIRMPRVPGPARALLGVVGFVFGGAGICMLALIWGSDSDFVPVPARLFGSLICLAFIAIAGTMLLGAIKGNLMGGRTIDLPEIAGGDPAADPRGSADKPGGYHCPHCGAALGEKAEVSPMGDVKCPFCGQWFNVRGK